MEQLDTVIGEDGALEALLEAKRAGKIGHIGLTAHSTAVFERVNSLDGDSAESHTGNLRPVFPSVVYFICAPPYFWYTIIYKMCLKLTKYATGIRRWHINKQLMLFRTEYSQSATCS